MSDALKPSQDIQNQPIKPTLENSYTSKPNERDILQNKQRLGGVINILGGWLKKNDETNGSQNTSAQDILQEVAQDQTTDAKKSPEEPIVTPIQEPKEPRPNLEEQKSEVVFKSENDNKTVEQSQDKPLEAGKPRNEIMASSTNRVMDIGNGMKLSVLYRITIDPPLSSSEFEAAIIPAEGHDLAIEGLHSDLFLSGKDTAQNMEQMAPHLEPLFAAMPGLVNLGATKDDLSNIIQIIESNYFENDTEVNSIDKSFPSRLILKTQNENGKAWEVSLPDQKHVILNDNLTTSYVIVNSVDETRNILLSSVGIPREKLGSDNGDLVPEAQLVALSDTIVGLTKLGLHQDQIKSIIEGLAEGYAIRTDMLGRLELKDRNDLKNEQEENTEEE